MSIQSINIGSVADDGTGDPLRTAFTKTNDNFIELESNVSSLNSNVSSLNASINLVNSNLISTVTSINLVNSNLTSNVSSLTASINLVNANLVSNVSSLTASINLVNANAVVLASNVSSLTANISNILSGTTSFAGNKTFTGNVGIGIAPSAKLDIAGTSSEKVIINMGGGTTPASTAALNIWTNAFGTSTGLSIGFSDGAAGNRGGITFNDIAAPGDWGVPRMDMIQTYGGASEIRSILNTQDTSWAGMKFTSQFGASTALTTSPSFVWNNYLTEQMRISANGFVGIGTASPTAKLDIAETWNNVSTTFTAIRANVTDTSSAAGSLLLDLQVGGASKFRVGKDGQVSAGSFMMGISPESTTSMSGLLRNGNNLLVNTVGTQAFNFSTASFISTRPIAFGTSAYAADVVLNRDAADTLAQRNGTSAQTSRIYGTYTDASNYERGYLTANTDGLTIGHEALGTGIKRPVRIVGQALAAAEAVSILDMSQTWNTTGTPTAVKVNVTDTASNAASLLMDLQVGGVSQFSMNKSGTLTVGNAAGSGGLRITNAGSIQPFLSRVPADGGLLLGSVGGSPPIYITQNDLAIAREAADTLAQRRGTNAQTSRIYNTYTDASNYERGVIGWTANALQIGTEAAGTGVARSLSISAAGGVGISAGASILILDTSSSTRFTVNGGAGAFFVQSNQVRVANFGLTFCATGNYNDPEFTILRDAPNTLAQRNGVNPQTSRIYNTYTDASNYERGVIGWTANALQIGTEAAGTGTRRPININYTTTIDGGSRTNVPALKINNVGAGAGGLEVGGLQIGHGQDNARIDTLYIANRGHAYKHGGTSVANQGIHRFTSDNNGGTASGNGGSIVDILAPSTATNIFQCRQANDAVVLNVAYSGAITIANTLTQSTEATTLATVTKTQIASFPVASFRSGKLLVQAYDTVTGATQISEILLAHNVTSASHTEYGIVFTGATSIVVYDVDIASANVRLMATRTTTNSTQYKISETLIAS